MQLECQSYKFQSSALPPRVPPQLSATLIVGSPTTMPSQSIQSTGYLTCQEMMSLYHVDFFIDWDLVEG